MRLRVQNVAGEPTIALETGAGRYGTEYGPYAGALIGCPRCGALIHWTLEEDVTSDYLVPMGFCSVCHMFVGR